MTQDAAGGSAPRRVQVSANRAPELRALLADLDDLRLTLSADLGLAASAVDVGADDIARDVLAGAQDDLAVFALRADFRLRDDSRPLREVEPGAEVVVPAAVPPRRPRRLAVLAPALTAAAALVGLLTGVVPATGQPAAPQRTVVTNAAASYAELWRLHEQGAPAASLARAARRLHVEVGRLVGLTALDPATAEQALQLLELELQVLTSPQHGRALAAERAESQRLITALRGAVHGTRLDPTGRVLVGRDTPAEPGAAAQRPAAPGAPARPAGTTSAAVPTAGAPASAPRQQSQPAPEQQQSSAETGPAPEESPPPDGSSAPPSRNERDPRTWFPAGGRVVLPE